MLKLGRLALVLFGLGLAGFGVQFLFWPTMLTDLAEIRLPTSVAQGEIRGVYGGVFLGTGLFWLLSARDTSLLRAGLTSLATVMGGLVVGRTLGLVLDGPTNTLIYGLYVLEIVGFIVSLAALRADAASRVLAGATRGTV